MYVAPSIHAFRRHLTVHHGDRLAVGRYGRAERYIAMAPDELCRRRLRLSCRQGGRAEARRQLAETIQAAEAPDPSPSSMRYRSVWDETNTAEVGRQSEYIFAGYTSGTPPSVSSLSSGGLTDDTNLSEDSEREYGSYIWGWGDLPELWGVDAADHLGAARRPLASAFSPMPPDSDWESDILSTQRPPEGRDVAASPIYVPPPPPAATPPSLRTDDAVPTTSTSPFSQLVVDAYIPPPADFQNETRPEDPDHSTADEEPPTAPGGSVAADDFGTAAGLFRELERPRETIPQLAALVSDTLASNRSLPVDAVQHRVQQLVTRGNAAQRRTVNLAVEFGCWLLSEMAAHVIRDVSAAYAGLDPTPFPTVALSFSETLREWNAQPHLRRFTMGEEDFSKDAADADAPVTIADSEDDDDAEGIHFLMSK